MPEPEGGRAAVEARFQLANAWLARGKTEAAVKAYLDTRAFSKSGRDSAEEGEGVGDRGAVVT